MRIIKYYIGTAVCDSNFLSHHGVLGMKWGKRNGPPYPLDAGKHSASEKKAGWQRSLDEKGYKKTVKGTLHRTAAANYELNARTYDHLGNKTMASMNRAAADTSRKEAEAADKAAFEKKRVKAEAKKQKASEKEERKKRLKEVDPDAAKNKQTKRVAMDYHILSDLKFRRKYKMSKEKFAKRYITYDGDTYSKGLQKATISAWVVAHSRDVPYYDLRSGRVRTVKMGQQQAVKLLAMDVGYSEAVTRLGYNKAEQTYSNALEEKKNNR